MSFKVPEQYRVRAGQLRSELPTHGLNGAFMIPNPKLGSSLTLRVIASDGAGLIDWEHVSVSLKMRCPTWEEMCYVKGLFWDDEDAVMQLHPPRSDWVNNHQFCLHLWRPLKQSIPLPDSLLVGYKQVGVLA